MNFTTLLVLLGLMGIVCSCPICREGCHVTDRHHQQHFTHVSELQHSSVAPWNLMIDSAKGREPEKILTAKCINCTVANMIAKPIVIKISVYERIRTCNETGASAWCKCPYDLPVGCTCVQKQASHSA